MSGGNVIEVNHPLQSPGSLTGNGNAVQLGGMVKNPTVYIVGGAGVSAGAIQLETAIETDYAGTWAPLGAAITVVADAVTIIDLAPLGGSALLAVRARISTTVDGAGVTVRITGN